MWYGRPATSTDTSQYSPRRLQTPRSEPLSDGAVEMKELSLRPSHTSILHVTERQLDILTFNLHTLELGLQAVGTIITYEHTFFGIQQSRSVGR